jgi:hypothetical protein
MARVSGPLMSMSASGTVGKALTFGKWKGRPWVREWFIPENPKTVKQVNIRTALSLLIEAWQGEDQATKDKWDAYAEPFKMAGVNKYVSKGMLAYVADLTVDVTPLSVSVAGDPPADVWTWVPVT